MVSQNPGPARVPAYILQGTQARLESAFRSDITILRHTTTPESPRGQRETWPPAGTFRGSLTLVPKRQSETAPFGGQQSQQEYTLHYPLSVLDQEPTPPDPTVRWFGLEDRLRIDGDVFSVQDLVPVAAGLAPQRRATLWKATQT